MVGEGDVAARVRILDDARRRGDYRLAMALTDSLKDSVVAEWRLWDHPVGQPATLAADGWRPLAELPGPWTDWAAGWSLYQTMTATEETGLERRAEPLDVTVAAPAGAVGSLARELRVARVDPTTGVPQEVTSQVYGETRTRVVGDPATAAPGGASGEGKESGERRARLVWQADVAAGGQTTYLVLAGNPAAELPDYPTDLRVGGQGVGLEIENAHFVAALSGQTGQLERLTYRRAHGLELFAGGEGHGEPPHLDWAHDYLAADRFNKFRVTNWETCPNVEVVRGPLCVTVRRWGFPHSPLHPYINASDLLIDLTYTFYAGVPYFTKHGRMEAVQDFSLNYLRDDEWVFSGYSFTDILWMDEDGHLREGDVPLEHAERMWGVGFYNRASHDAFFALRLEHRLDGPSAGGAAPGVPPERRLVLRHADAPMFSYVPHGHVWSRWAARGTPQLLAGDTLRQRNAYLVEPYAGESDKAHLEDWRRRLLAPLRLAVAGGVGAPRPIEPAAPVGVLARPGEQPAAQSLKAAIWTALRQVRDEMFYIADANVVDMGYVYDLRLRGETVQVLMTMPNRGRPRYMFIGQYIKPLVEGLPGVRSAVVDLTWDPPWTPDRLTDAGWTAMGFDGPRRSALG